MRSIRLSLIFYFLLLLGAALGGVSYFCYQSTDEALAAREISTRQLWEKQFDENKRRLETDYQASKQRAFADFDAKTEGQARALGRQNHLVSEPSRRAVRTGCARHHWERPRQFPVVFVTTECLDQV